MIEELLEGEEVSVFALADGATVVPLAPAQDFKRIGDGDTGPNTGGMGSYSPVPGMGAAEVAELVEQIHAPVIEELARRGAPFIGVLFAGLMLTETGRRCSSSTAASATRRRSRSCPGSRGTSSARSPRPRAASSAGVELTASEELPSRSCSPAGEYPERSDSGTAIEGIEDAEAAGALVFHAGTALHGDRLVTNGGRILGVTGTGATIGEARERAYAGCERITFAGAPLPLATSRLAASGAAYPAGDAGAGR